MVYSHLKNYTCNVDKLKEYGFSLIDGNYILKIDLDFNLYCIISLKKDILEVKVFDKELNEEYILFNTNRNTLIHEKVNNIIDDIINKCFIENNIVKTIIDQIENKYLIIHENPWEEYPDHYTFKTLKSKKWFAIIMKINSKKLGFKDDFPCSVINVKLPPETILDLIDYKAYFPAYHMNKKSWISILIDNNTDLQKLFELINISFNLVEK